MRKSVLITGGARGIGLALCKRFISGGYNVVASYNLSEKEAERLGRELGIMFIKCDMTSADDIENLIQQAGAVDTLICNAGVSLVSLVTDTTLSQFKTVMDTNFTSVFSLTRGVLPKMIARGGGQIINISSMWGLHGASCESVYSASKAAVNGFTKSIAKETALMNIRANSVCCGAVNTDMLSQYSAVDLQLIKDDSLFGRLLDPSEVANLAYYLASDEATAISGQCIEINNC